jgi:cytochrome c
MMKAKVAMAALALALLGSIVLGGTARAEGDVAKGEVKFKECAACHKLEAGANNVGPSLHGIIGRPAGGLPDFRYSPAIKRSGITWTADTLDAFIKEPQAMVPANRMPYAGLANPADRADLVAYLQKAAK